MKINFVTSRSPSQSQDSFESFIDNLELNIDAICGKKILIFDWHFWFRSDKSTYEGSTIDGLVSNYGLQQPINESTRTTGSSSSYIDLLFCSQPNLVMESGVHPTLHPNCHYQIIYAKFKLKVYYPPPYEREVWHYQNADSNAMKKANLIFFLGKGILKPFCWWKVSLFNKTIKNILSNYIPHDIITIDDRDPPGFNKNAKSLIDEIKKHGDFMFEVIEIFFFLKNLIHFKSN